MRILSIHSYYQQPGGEDAVFNQEHMLLRESEDVAVLEFKNQPGLRGARQFLLSIWNVFSARKLKKLIGEYQPDIIHLHNFHFAIGPIAVRVAEKAGVPIVLTLHNYRLLCPSATLLYKEQLFTDSIQSSFPWKAIRNKVYRDSFFETFWLGFTIWFHKKIGTWKKVDKYILLTDFSRTLFARSSFGVAPEKFVTKPNFRNIPAPQPAPPVKGQHFLFVGRLSAEKGIRVLLEAFSHTPYELHIAGDGPLKEEVMVAAEKNSNIKMLGSLDKSGVENAMQECTALIFPSIWYEGMPMTILEALSLGTPVIASNLGAMASIIRDDANGMHFKAGDANELTKKLNSWQNMEESERDHYRRNAFASYQSNYTPEKNKAQLLNIYKTILYAKATH